MDSDEAIFCRRARSAEVKKPLLRSVTYSSPNLLVRCNESITFKRKYNLRVQRVLTCYFCNTFTVQFACMGDAKRQAAFPAVTAMKLAAKHILRVLRSVENAQLSSNIQYSAQIGS